MTPKRWNGPHTLRKEETTTRASPLHEAGEVRTCWWGAVWVVAVICCGLPLGWLAWQMVANPGVLVEAVVDKFRLALLVRTLLYNGEVAVVATGLALPVAMVVGRGKGGVVAGFRLRRRCHCCFRR